MTKINAKYYCWGGGTYDCGFESVHLLTALIEREKINKILLIQKWANPGILFIYSNTHHKFYNK